MIILFGKQERFLGDSISAGPKCECVGFQSLERYGMSIGEGVKGISSY